MASLEEGAGEVMKGAVALLVVSVSLVVAMRASSEEGKREPFPQMRAPFYGLVDEGQPVAVVVCRTESSPVEAFAVEELVAYVKRITGAELSDAESATSGAYPIYIGTEARERLQEFDWDKLGEEGFLLRSGPEGLYIAGAKELGTLYGVYTLLERFGVRWFMPDEIGEVIPSVRDLRVGDLDESQTPSFKYRWIGSGDWALKNRMNIAVDVHGEPVGPQWKWGFHTHFLLIPPETYFDEHPEWFAEVGGRRRRPKDKHHQGRQLCTSNPELIQQMAENIVALF